VFTAIPIIYNIQLFCYFVQKNRNKIIYLLSNLALLFLALFLNFEQANMTLFQIVVFPISCLFTTSVCMIFTFVYKDSFKLNMLKEVDQNELKQYKQIFNSMQEGVLVLQV
jgi:hypothetical protein